MNHHYQWKGYHPSYWNYPYPYTSYQPSSGQQQHGEQPVHQEEVWHDQQPNHTNELLEQLDRIYQKLNQLEEENKEIKEELANKKSVTVENVNNKIQDLNVQELSGSLLVGLSSLSDAEELQELLADNDQVSFNGMDTEEVENNIMNQQNEEETMNQDNQNGTANSESNQTTDNNPSS
ncbi:hypothetical protein [Aquibacillus sediminis]|uniref:hypothetical protein n=1 Tax=Aquibacillus sediminis TaxID=2574734 RepID=UPI0011099CAE|nr:hypothetical protein [Aquibacillus sediminis]